MTVEEFTEIEKAFWALARCYPAELDIKAVPGYAGYMEAKDKFFASLSATAKQKKQKLDDLLNRHGIKNADQSNFS